MLRLRTFAIVLPVELEIEIGGAVGFLIVKLFTSSSGIKNQFFFLCEKWAEYCAWDQNGSVEALCREKGNDVQITAGDTTSCTHSSVTLHHLALPISYFSLCLSC